jgi:hypothetical protein
MAAATTALSPAVSCNPKVKASRAAASNAAPVSVGSWLATPTAAPRVSRAVAAASAEMPAGRASASRPL